jgi:type I restriction enzyme S subunit
MLEKNGLINEYWIFSHGIHEEPRQDTVLGLLPHSWGAVRIKDLSLDLGSGNPQSKISSSDCVYIEWVQIQDLNEGLISQTAKKSKYSSNSPISDKIRSKYTVMIAKSGSVGKVGILGMPATTNTAICCIVPNQEVIDPYYLMYFLKSRKDSWSRVVFGTRAGARLTNNFIADVYVPVPCLEEQRAIIRMLKGDDVN